VAIGGNLSTNFKMERLMRLKTVFLLLFLSWLAQAEKPNVLLILVDDLKPAMGCYGDAHAITPAMDALAKRGMRFDLAYCNQAVCAPSRFTLMLGSHSTSTGLYGLGSQLRQVLPKAVTMPQYFAKHGYRTESLGKVFHIGHGNLGDPKSFSIPHFHDKVIEYLDPESTDGGKLTREEALFTNQKLGGIRSLPRGAAFEAPVAKDDDYADGRVATETIRRLKAAKTRREKDGTPFFITAGFVRPHLPFSAPKKYWDMFDPAKLPMPKIKTFPKDAPPVALKRGGEISAYKPVPVNGQVDEALTRELIHGYYASTAYVDVQIGRVTAALKKLGLEDDTIVVLWGDHGWHLGDLSIWTKHTNYEQANRIPILIVAPGVAKAGSATRQLAETVDIYPTVAELAGLPVPKGPQSIDGKSLVPVLKNPKARVREHAFHAYPRRRLGRAIRTERYRLVEWRNPGEPVSKAEYELYDYSTGEVETVNLAKQKPALVRQLAATLAKYPEPVSRGARKPKKKK
jgi:iduronate 2-sulfatase